MQSEVFIHKVRNEQDVRVLSAGRPDICRGRHPHIAERGQLLDHFGHGALCIVAHSLFVGMGCLDIEHIVVECDKVVELRSVNAL